MIGKNELYRANIDIQGSKDRETALMAFILENGFEYKPNDWSAYLKCDSLYDSYEIMKANWKDL